MPEFFFRFKENLRRFYKTAPVLLLPVLFLISAAFLTGATSVHLYQVYQNSRETMHTIASMKGTIQEWKIRSSYLNSQPYRPVTGEQVSSVQADLLTILKQKDITLLDYRPANAASSTLYQTYDMMCSGSYDAITSFLEDFHARDALLNIQSLAIENQQGKTVAHIVYRVYTK